MMGSYDDDSFCIEPMRKSRVSWKIQMNQTLKDFKKCTISTSFAHEICIVHPGVSVVVSGSNSKHDDHDDAQYVNLG